MSSHLRTSISRSYIVSYFKIGSLFIEMPRVLVCIAVVSVLTCTAHAQSISPAAEYEQISGKPQNNGSSGIEVYEELFKKSFSYQRKEHTEAIKRLQRLDSYERLYKMITVLGEKMIEVMETSKTIIENGGFNPDDKSLPRNVTIQSAVSTTLENTALFGDILLHFPHFVHRVLKMKEKWKPIISWSLNFTNRTRYLLDTETVNRIHLTSQELNIIEREPGYSNPYWQSAESQKNKEGTKKKKSMKRDKQRRGPKMAKIEL